MRAEEPLGVPFGFDACSKFEHFVFRQVRLADITYRLAAARRVAQFAPFALPAQAILQRNDDFAEAMEGSRRLGGGEGLADIAVFGFVSIHIAPGLPPHVGL